MYKYKYDINNDIKKSKIIYRIRKGLMSKKQTKTCKSSKITYTCIKNKYAQSQTVITVIKYTY